MRNYMKNSSTTHFSFNAANKSGTVASEGK